MLPTFRPRVQWFSMVRHSLPIAIPTVHGENGQHNIIHDGIRWEGLRLGSGKDARHVLRCASPTIFFPDTTVTSGDLGVAIPLHSTLGFGVSYQWLLVVTRYIIEDGKWKGAVPSDDEVGFGHIMTHLSAAVVKLVEGTIFWPWKAKKDIGSTTGCWGFHTYSSPIDPIGNTLVLITMESPMESPDSHDISLFWLLAVGSPLRSVIFPGSSRKQIGIGAFALRSLWDCLLESEENHMGLFKNHTVLFPNTSSSFTF